VRTSLFSGSILSVCVTLGCGGSATTQGATKISDKQVSGVASDDASRCDYKGRADREVQEVRGPGAQQPNIRRVFAIVGEGRIVRKSCSVAKSTPIWTVPRT